MPVLGESKAGVELLDTIKYFFICILIGAVGGYVLRLTTEREKKPVIHERVEWRIRFDTVQPPPIVKWLKPEKITVRVTDTLIREAFENAPGVPTPDPDDSVETYRMLETYTRGVDTVWVGTIFYGKPFESFKQRVKFNPDHWRERVEYVSRKHPILEIAPGATVGVDVRGRFNVVGGVSFTLHFRDLFHKLNPF